LHVTKDKGQRTKDESYNLEERLLEYVNSANYQPLKPKLLAKKLGLSKEETKDLRKAVRKLVKRGQLSWGVSHLVRKAGGVDEADRITGVFRRTQEGHGFVIPAGAVPGRDRRHDIYISASNARDAATGDIVLVKLGHRHGYRGRPEGMILEVIERETHRFVGTYSEMGGQGFVTVDGTLFSQPIAVGDPGAKNARVDDKVVFEMVRFPSHSHDGEGVLVEVLGPRGQPGVDTLCIIHEFDLPGEFHEEALAEARHEADRFDEKIPAWRQDLTAETIITIDPEDARDFDDAISLARLENGHWRLGVHIADVSHFVRPDTMLDREAYSRATSVYLPDRVIPMLPEVISNSLASLQPDRVRYTKTAFIEFTADGARVAVDLCQSAIRSKRRFTYEEVDDYLARPAHWKSKLTPEVHALLGRMRELAMILRRRRMTRGALELSMPEVKIDLDGDGRVCGAHTVPNTESHQIIEEFMLAANEAVASRLHEAEWQFLRRVHEAPSPLKLKALTEFIKELGRGVDYLEVDNLQDRFALQKLLNGVLGQPEQRAVHYAVLRSLPRAIYSPAEEGHFALGSDCYCHFTSPIRRYPDLTVHRLVDALLANKSGYHEFGQLASWAEHCSEREQRAEAAERELTKVKLLLYLSDRIGDEMDAVITGVESYGLFAQGLELPAEGLIHITSLDDDFYRYDRGAHTLTGNRAGHIFRLGDLIRVTVYRVDLERRELDFRLVAKVKRPGAKKGRPSRVKMKKARKTKTMRPKRSRR
jgi:ribonuclease R